CGSGLGPRCRVADVLGEVVADLVHVGLRGNRGEVADGFEGVGDHLRHLRARGGDRVMDDGQAGGAIDPHRGAPRLRGVAVALPMWYTSGCAGSEVRSRTCSRVSATTFGTFAPVAVIALWTMDRRVLISICIVVLLGFSGWSCRCGWRQRAARARRRARKGRGR